MLLLCVLGVPMWLGDSITQIWWVVVVLCSGFFDWCCDSDCSVGCVEGLVFGCGVVVGSFLTYCEVCVVCGVLI